MAGAASLMPHASAAIANGEERTWRIRVHPLRWPMKCSQPSRGRRRGSRMSPLCPQAMACAAICVDRPVRLFCAWSSYAGARLV